MVVAPAAAARQWTNRLSRMVLLSGLFGALSGIAGSILSSAISDLPTGPTIVLCLTAIVVLSLLLAPNRGLLTKLVGKYRNRHRFSLQSLLVDMYTLENQHPEHGRFHEQATLALIRKRPGNIRYSLDVLNERNLVENDGSGRWRLTEGGTKRAISITEGRLDET
jgi:manganese/zinc/iron transport system permease protein